jgi:hypothetical protein
MKSIEILSLIATLGCLSSSFLVTTFSNKASGYVTITAGFFSRINTIQYFGTKQDISVICFLNLIRTTKWTGIKVRLALQSFVRDHSSSRPLLLYCLKQLKRQLCFKNRANYKWHCRTQESDKCILQLLSCKHTAICRFLRRTIIDRV